MPLKIIFFFLDILKNFVTGFSWKQSKMKTNILTDILPPIPYLVKLWVSCYWPECCQSIKLQDFSKCNISRRNWMMKCIFCMKIDIKVFYRLMLSFWVCATRYAQSTQKKFAYFSNISRKGWEMKFIFCLQIKTSFLQIDITLGVFSQACSKYPKQQVYNIFAILQGKCEGWSWFFACW